MKDCSWQRMPIGHANNKQGLCLKMARGSKWPSPAPSSPRHRSSEDLEPSHATVDSVSLPTWQKPHSPTLVLLRSLTSVSQSDHNLLLGIYKLLIRVAPLQFKWLATARWVTCLGLNPLVFYSFNTKETIKTQRTQTQEQNTPS